MSMFLFNSANPEGKGPIGEQEGCTLITDPSKPIFFLVHGFISSANTTNNYDLASKLVKKGGTVFSLDWSTAACKNGPPGLKLLEYPEAVKNTREIGQLMAKYVISLVKGCNIPLNNMTFIGHSLGAHVCSFAAKKIQNTIDDKVELIIGADPAAPLFEKNKCNERLCITDAKHIVVLHTSVLGFTNACNPSPCRLIGHVILQVNGGTKQPECAAVDVPCSHTRSLQLLYLMSNTCVYPGVKMPKPTLLGNIFGSTPSYPGPTTTDCIVLNDQIFNFKPSDKLNEGNYYLFVEKKFPYCTNESFSCNSLIIPSK
ncbi:phospholipase A1-like isoform X2 [Camponotus floridanus]|nr:phospholipase A1-like isoform X2 [Camponotus floridanus]